MRYTLSNIRIIIDFAVFLLWDKMLFRLKILYLKNLIKNLCSSCVIQDYIF